MKKNIKEKPIVKTDYRFKIIYAIDMMCVLASHLQGKGSIELNIQDWFPYRSFHMPLFMFSSGYFFKIKNVSHSSNYIFRKFKRLILPIYSYNLIYGFFLQLLKRMGFKNITKSFSLSIILIEPLGGSDFSLIRASWFSSSLFFVEIYNIIKRKAISLFKFEPNEIMYFIIDFFISYYSVTLSNKDYNKIKLYKHILRFFHLNIYYEFGILFNKHIEFFTRKIKNDIYFIIIFLLKLCFYLYYANVPVFQYSRSIYYNYSPFTVVIISTLGIVFWLRISELLQPMLGKNFYINIIADNTFSIMMNHLFAIFIIKTIFAIISKNTNYCKDFNFYKYYNMNNYIYIPNNILQTGIIYFLSCLIIPIIIQKIINKIKHMISKFCSIKNLK